MGLGTGRGTIIDKRLLKLINRNILISIYICFFFFLGRGDCIISCSSFFCCCCKFNVNAQTSMVRVVVVDVNVYLLL